VSVKYKPLADREATVNDPNFVP